MQAESASRAEILALRRRTAFVFQNYALFANKTARENITQALITVQGLPKAEANARAEAILRETGGWPIRPITTLPRFRAGNSSASGLAAQWR